MSPPVSRSAPRSLSPRRSRRNSGPRQSQEPSRTATVWQFASEEERRTTVATRDDDDARGPVDSAGRSVLRDIQSSQSARKGSDGESEIVYEEYQEDLNARRPSVPSSPSATTPRWTALRAGPERQIEGGPRRPACAPDAPLLRPSRTSCALLLVGSSVAVAAGLLMMRGATYQEPAAGVSCDTPGPNCAGRDGVMDEGPARQALVIPSNVTGEAELWTYAPANGMPIDTREVPDIDGKRTGKTLVPGDTFRVIEEKKVGAVTFLRLAGGEGWLFDNKPNVGLMCKKVKAPEEAVAANTTSPPAAEGNTTSNTSTTTHVKWSPKEPEHPLPAGLTGVNLGSWLCLEDWFFSGEEGRYVDSGWQTGQGNCLYPEKPELDFQWKSEGELTKLLGKEAVKVIGAHRRTFITEADFAQAAKLGIRTVRIPITWAAFADALSEISPEHYGKHDPDKEEVSVPDPFYHEDIFMVTIPRDFLRSILDWAANHELKVVWDIHAHPGGSANGTFNGIWPRVPAFWFQKCKIGDTSRPLTEAGLLVTRALVKWVEGLDERQQSAVAGLTLMNEPGHLSWGQEWSSNEAVLDWLVVAADVFRNSSLPEKGMRLYLNLVETAFGNWGADFGELVPDWWYSTFSDDERRDWAVIDRHKYYSWDTQCSGCDGDMCDWHCDTQTDVARNKLRGCIETWQTNFNKMFEGGLRAASEFSTSTYRDAAIACRDMGLARALLEDQVAAFRANNVEGFFWTWRIPYGPKFQSGWSLKHLTGVEDEIAPDACAAAPGQRRELLVEFGSKTESAPIAREGDGQQPAAGALGNPRLLIQPGRGDPQINLAALHAAFTPPAVLAAPSPSASLES